MVKPETAPPGGLAVPPGMATVAVEGGEVVIRVHVPQAEAVDELVCVEPKTMKAMSLEYLAIVRLCQEGTLRSVFIGRKRYTKRSWLVALADALPAAKSTLPEADDLRAAVEKAARRQVRRTTRAAELDA